MSKIRTIWSLLIVGAALSFYFYMGIEVKLQVGNRAHEANVILILDNDTVLNRDIERTYPNEKFKFTRNVGFCNYKIVVDNELAGEGRLTMFLDRNLHLVISPEKNGKLQLKVSEGIQDPDVDIR